MYEWINTEGNENTFPSDAFIESHIKGTPMTNASQEQIELWNKRYGKPITFNTFSEAQNYQRFLTRYFSKESTSLVPTYAGKYEVSVEKPTKEGKFYEYEEQPIVHTKDSGLQALKGTSLSIRDMLDSSRNKNKLMTLLRGRGKYNSILDLIESSGKSLKERMADVKVVFDEVNQQTNKPLYNSYKGRRAYYDSTDKVIHIDINASYTDGDASSVIMHEVMHSITLDLLASNEDSRNSLQAVLDEYSSKVNSTRYSNEHGLQEFVADIWSNPKVIEELKNTKSDDSNLTLWDKVKMFFNSLFSGELFSNVKNDSLMAKATDELMQLLSKEATERQLGYYFEDESDTELVDEAYSRTSANEIVQDLITFDGYSKDDIIVKFIKSDSEEIDDVYEIRIKKSALHQEEVKSQESVEEILVEQAEETETDEPLSKED